EVIAFPPAIAAVKGIPNAAVVAGDYIVGVVRIDPDIVKVSVRAAGDVAEALAAVVARNQRSVRLVDFVFVFGIDNQVREVEWAPDHVLAAIELSPGLSPIIGTVKAILRYLSFDKRVHGTGPGRSNRDGYATPWLWRKSRSALLIELGPRRAAL